MFKSIDVEQSAEAEINVAAAQNRVSESGAGILFRCIQMRKTDILKSSCSGQFPQSMCFDLSQETSACMGQNAGVIDNKESIVHISEICTRNVVCARRDLTVKAAAQLMREYHVGSVVVVEEMGEKRIPTGIITDRDITVAVVALALDPEVIQIGDVTAGALVSVRGNWAIAEVVELMQIRSLRRMVVTDADGYLFGIVSADDVLAHLAEEMRQLASMADGERHREAALRKVLA